MRLELGTFPVTNIQFGERTRYERVPSVTRQPPPSSRATCSAAGASSLVDLGNLIAQQTGVFTRAGIERCLHDWAVPRIDRHDRA